MRNVDVHFSIVDIDYKVKKYIRPFKQQSVVKIISRNYSDLERKNFKTIC